MTDADGLEREGTVLCKAAGCVMTLVVAGIASFDAVVEGPVLTVSLALRSRG